MSAGSTTIEASLRLDIAQLQAQLAASKGEATKWREKMQQEGRKASASVQTVAEAYALTKAKAEQAKAVNPWTGLSASAVEYANIIKQKVNAEQERAAAFAKNLAKFDNVGQKTREIFAPKASNPWASAGAPAYQQQLQARETMRAHQAEQERQALLAHQSTLAYRETINPFVGRRNEGVDTNRILAQQAMQQRSQAAQAASMRGNGGGRVQIGMMAMQLQDITVQAQMGTRATTILAQQGSQLLSAFGTSGAVVGGVVAIGGAFLELGAKAQEAFDGMRKDHEDLNRELKEGLAGATLPEVAALLGKVRDNSSSAVKEMEGLQKGWSGIMAHAAEWFGGPKVADRDKQANEIRIQRIQDEILMNQKAVEISAQGVRLAELKAAGQTEAAEALQRQIDLAKELAKIEASGFTPEVKVQLSADARQRSDFSAAKPRDEKKDKEDIAAIEERIVDLNLKQLDPAERFLALAKEQDAVFAKMATTGGLFYEQSIAGLEAWAEAKKKMGDNAGAIDVLKQLEKAKALQAAMGQASEESKQEVLSKDRDRDKEREEAKRIKQMREELDIETKIAREQARTGKDDTHTINSFRDELNTKQLTAQIQERLKLSEKEAVQLAREKVNAERDAANAIRAQGMADKARGQLRNRQQLAAEMKVDSLRAAGKDEEADKLEKRIKLANEIQRIVAQTQLTEQQAAQIAKKRLDDQERAAARAARAAGLSTGDTTPRKITRKHSEDPDPNGRYGLAGRPSGPLANVGPLSQHGPMTENGGINGFWRMQTGEYGMSSRPSNLGYGLMGDPPLKAQQEQNAAGTDKGGDWQSSLMNRLKTELGPSIGETIAKAILAET